MGSSVIKNFDAARELGSTEHFPLERKNITILPVVARSARKFPGSPRKKTGEHLALIPEAKPTEEKPFSPYDLMLADPSYEAKQESANVSEFDNYSFYKTGQAAHYLERGPIIAEAHSARGGAKQDEQTADDSDRIYIVGNWVINTIPCMIRGIEEGAPIRSIRYPRGNKRRFFTYRDGQLINVETVLGENDKEKTRVVYKRDMNTNAWHMTLDGITSRLPGEISLSDTGVLHVQVDDSGRCRREYPDGTISVDMACSSHHRGAHALVQALMTEDDGQEGRNHRTVLDLLSVVSHDLRSPLTSVQGLLTLLSAGAFGDIPDKARERIAGVESDLTRLTRLINELLDAEMLVSGKLIMRKQLVDVQDLFDAAVGSLSGLSLQQKVHLNVIKSNLQLYADKDRLVRVLVNIVANAIKYSPKGATVVLSAEFNGDSIILKVKDAGRGIPTKYQRAIFERFQQVSEGDWSEKGGVGLGLAISKSIVEAHGGAIGVESHSAGTGSVFWVCLPANTLAEYDVCE